MQWRRMVNGVHFRPLLVLTIATLVVYGRILGHDFVFNWDDARYVVDNKAIQGFSASNVLEIVTSSYVGNYAPVQMFSYMLDFSLWGLRAGGFLFTNILIHLANGLLFYRLLYSLYVDRMLALTAAAFFLLHPVQVESVAWVSQRKNLLAMLFFLLAWEGYRRYRASQPGKGRLAYGASLAAFVAALLAKSVTVVMPAVLILFDLCFFSAGRRRQLQDKVPFLLAAGVVAVLTVYIQGAEFGGGRAEFHGGGPLATFYTMVTVFCRYLWMLVWPVGLSAVYAPTIHTSPDAAVIGAALLLGGVALAGWVLFRRDRRSGFWVLFFFIGLVPVSQIVPLVTLMNDRYLYFPMLGGAALFGTAVALLRERFGSYRAVATAAVPLLLLSVLSVQRAAVWRDPLTLWTDAVAKSPGASYAWSSLAEVYFRELRVSEALAAYEKSLELNPQNRMAIAALGPIYTELGELDKGYAMLRRFLAMQPRDVKGWAYLGINYRQRGDYVEAERMYRKALAINPDSRKVILLMGELALQQGKFDQARDVFLQAEKSGENDPEIAYRLACVASRSDHVAEALVWLEKALQRGYRDYGTLYESEELAALWNEPRFTMLLRQYFPDEVPVR